MKKKVAWNNSNEKLSKKTEEKVGNQRNQGSYANLKSKRRIKYSREKKDQERKENLYWILRGTKREEYSRKTKKFMQDTLKKKRP